jgi:hypothetical protein
LDPRTISPAHIPRDKRRDQAAIDRDANRGGEDRRQVHCATVRLNGHNTNSHAAYASRTFRSSRRKLVRSSDKESDLLSLAIEIAFKQP